MSMNGVVYQPTTFIYESERPRQQEWLPRKIATTVAKAARRRCGVSLVVLRNLLPMIYYVSLTLAAFAIGSVFVYIGARGFRKEYSKTNASMIIMGVMLFMIGFLFITLLCKYRHIICESENSEAQTFSMNASNEFLCPSRN